MDRTAEPSALIRALAATPGRMDAVGRRLSAAELMASPEPGAWSPNEILWHIRAQADVYGEHIGRIVNEEAPGWRHVSPRARMKKSRYDQLPFAESFAAFARQRGELVALLASLGPEAWQRFAIVRVDPRESRLTLRERVWGMAHHEGIHCAQMEATAAAAERGCEAGEPGKGKRAR